MLQPPPSPRSRDSHIVPSGSPIVNPYEGFKDPSPDVQRRPVVQFKALPDYVEDHHSPETRAPTPLVPAYPDAQEERRRIQRQQLQQRAFEDTTAYAPAIPRFPERRAHHAHCAPDSFIPEPGVAQAYDSHMSVQRFCPTHAHPVSCDVGVWMMKYYDHDRKARQAKLELSHIRPDHYMNHHCHGERCEAPYCRYNLHNAWAQYCFFMAENISDRDHYHKQMRSSVS